MRAVAVENSGAVLYFAEHWDTAQEANWVRKLTAPGNPAASMSIYAGSTTGVNDGLSPLSARLRLPRGIVPDGAGNLIVADAGTHRIRKLPASSGGTISTLFDGSDGCGLGSDLLTPSSVAYDASNGDIYVASPWRHKVDRLSSGTLTLAAGTGSPGLVDTGGGSNATLQQLSQPWSIAMDANRHLFIADSQNHCIRRVDLSVNPSPIVTVAGTCGSSGSTPENGPALSTPLFYPVAIAVNAAGTEIYIADTFNSRIRKVSGGTITTLANASLNGVSNPVAIAVGTTGDVFYSDATHRVRKIASGVVTTVAGTGQFGFNGDGGSADQAALNLFRPENGAMPNGLAISGTSLFLADSYNNRIRKIESSGTMCTYSASPASYTIGPAGGIAGAVTVTNTPTSCPITVTVNDPWISVFPFAGLYFVAAQSTTVARTGTVSFSGQVFTMNQLGPSSCQYSMPPGPQAFNGAGGTGTIPITATLWSPGCTWTAQSTASWITLTGPTSGSATTGTIQFSVAPNQSCAARSATITLGSGVQTTITQSFTPPFLGVFRNGTWYFDSNHDGVLTSSDLSTTTFGVTGDYPFFEKWMWDTSGQAKETIFRSADHRWLFDRDGSGTVSAADGSAIDYVAGDTLPVVGDWNSTGGAKIGSFFPPLGEWYLDKTGDTFYGGALTDFIFNGFGQSGDQPVAGNWNNSSAGVRVGVFRQSTGQWLLRQNALASSSSTTATTIPNFGVNGDIAIAGDWSGDGKAKIGLFRNGTWLLDCKNDHNILTALTYQFGAAGDRPFIANVQACASFLKPNSASVAGYGDYRTFRVYTAPGCAWTAVSSASWVTILSGASGNGNGLVVFRVAPLYSDSSRVGVINVAGRAFVVHQWPTINPLKLTSQSYTGEATGGDYSLAVNVSAGQDWTPSVSDDWITAIRNGTGGLSCNLAPNTGPLPRTGSISVAGQVCQVMQRSATPVQLFGDVALTHPFFDYIWLLKDNAVTAGCTASSYCPDASTTRGQMAVFIIRSLIGDSFSYSPSAYFGDVAATHPFFPYIQKMKELGITSGCTATNYCPDDPVTRGQMAVFLIRGRLSLTASDTFPFETAASFSDVAGTHPFFAFIQKMKELGITSGCSATNYCPDSPTTRGQMAVFLIRAFFTP